MDLTREVWLLRHGATEWSEAGRYCGHADPPLSARGRQQVLPRRAELAGISFDHVWSSDLRRCVETARIVVGDATLDTRLREFDFGEMEGLLFDDLDKATQSEIITFDGFTAPGGETVSGFGNRIESFFDELPEGRHLIITHGGVIRFLLRRLSHDFSVPPGALVRLSARSPDGLAAEPAGKEADRFQHRAQA